MAPPIRARAVRVLSGLANGLRYSVAIRRGRFVHAEWNALLRHYPELDADFKACVASQNDIIKILRVEAADIRAREGWNKPVWYEGEHVGDERCYSDRLLEKLLTADDPARFSDKVDQNITGALVWKSETPTPSPRPPGV